MTAPFSDQRFATTSWTIVRDASNASDDAARVALQSLCQTYWYPLYAYLRRRGFAVEDAQDVTQSFIASLLEKNSFARADPELGRFRSFLLGSLKKFVIDWQRHRQAQKRGSETSIFSIDATKAESRYELEPVDVMTPERIFARRWALTLLETALDGLARSYAQKQQTDLFNALRPHLNGDSDATNYKEIADSLAMTEGAVKAAAHRLRKRYRRQLQDLIAETVTGPDELKSELNELFSALG